MLVKIRKGIILLLSLALYSTVSAATNHSQCFAEVINCANGSGNCTWDISSTIALSILRTSQGHKVTSATDTATALSYAGCTTYCGTGLGQVTWTSFTEQYAAWLLPFLALVSQLPFGAPRRTENLMSAILTLGSPALAGYSLYMTLLNSRWVNDQLFAGIDYPNPTVRQSVVRVLSSLQQVPLRIHPGESAGFEHLVVHPDNDNWWNTLAEELDYSRRWSIASATSIAWVVVAYLLTVADSIYNVPNNIQSSGLGTGSGWLWLLSIVVGWLVLSPQCDYKRVHNTYRKATPPTPDFGLDIFTSPDPDWLYGRDITSPDELRTPPVFNYSRVFSWYRNVYTASLFYQAAWRRKSRDRVGVDGSCIPEYTRDSTPRESRLGTSDQIIQYCRPVGLKHTGIHVLWPRGLSSNIIVASLMSLQLQWGTTGAALLVAYFSPTVGIGCRSLAYLIYGALSTAILMLLVLSSALGYYAHHLLHGLPTLSDLEGDDQRTLLGTPSTPPRCNPISSPTDSGSRVSPGDCTSAIPLVETPTLNGLEERENLQSDARSGASISFSTTKSHRRTRQTCGQIMLHVADWLRWIGKLLAIVNTIGTIANSVFQYAGVYTNCFCDSSVFSWGASAFTVIAPDQGDIDIARRAWMGALALAVSSCSIFLGSIYLVRDALPWQ